MPVRWRFVAEWGLLIGAIPLAGCAAGPAPGIPVAMVADRSQWPSEAELSGLQPHARHFNMGYHHSDVPIFLAPAARDIVCQTLTRSPLTLKCRYRLIAADWIGGDRPTRQVQDLIGHDADGDWKILGFDVD